MVSPAEADRLRQAQRGIRVLVERDLAAFFGSLNLNRPESARDALLEFVPLLVARYGEMAAAVAADWYDDQRAAERIPGRYRAEMVNSPYEGAATVGLVRRAAGALFTPRPEDALTSISTKAGKYVLAAARQTIATSTHRDPRSSGWERVTRGGACRFCRMLAGRGGVYKESTAFFASHGDCNCAAVPSWDPDAPEVDAFLYEASRRTTGMSPSERARHNRVLRDAIDYFVPE